MSIFMKIIGLLFISGALFAQDQVRFQATQLVRTPQNDAKNTVTPKTSSVTPMTLRGLSGQTADMLKVQNSTGTNLARIDKDGKFIGDGSLLTGVGGGGGANVNLSNLSSVAINADLVPGSHETLDLGALGLAYNQAFARLYHIYDSDGGSGIVTLQTAEVTDTYGFILPINVGSIGQILTNNGPGNALSWEAPGGGFANDTLSNLDSPTAVNQSLTPGTANSFSLGDTAFPWSNMVSNAWQIKSGTTVATFSISGADVILNDERHAGGFYITTSNSGFGGQPSSSILMRTGDHDFNGDSGSISFTTGNPAGTTRNSGPLALTTGTSGNGDSGDISLTTGGATVTRGKIQFVDGSEGTSGYVWTSIDVNGRGAWMPGGGATTELDNLTTTSINASLIPDTNETLSLGSAAFNWGEIFAVQVQSGIDAGSGQGGTAAGIQIGSAFQTAAGNDTNSGNTQIYTGDVRDGSSGNISISVGNVVGGGSGDRGNITLSASSMMFTAEDEYTFTGEKFTLTEAHLRTQGTNPTTTEEAGAGTGAAASLLASTDVAGTLQLTTGTGAASGAQVTITFEVPYSQAPKVVLFPKNSDSAIAATKIYITATNTTFVINAGTALIDATNYEWDYHVIEVP